MRPITTFFLMTVMATGLAGQEQTPTEGSSGYSGLRAPPERSETTQTERPEKPFQYNGNGHVYFSTGVCQHGYKHVGVGGGGEAFLWRGLAVGGSAGYHQFVDSFGFGLASLDLGYHFTDRKRPARFDPFVSVSPLGAAFAGGTSFAGGVGGGVNYWFKERIGLRTEVRVQMLDVEETVVMFRIGVNFR